MSHQPPSHHNPHLAETCDQATDDKAAELVRILDQHLVELKAGHAPSRTELIARHPELASQLEACLAGLEFIHGAEAAPGRSQRLGDFRIIREVGRGGMGAVFEAEQISLGRRVALKILRFGGVSDPEAIERFQREAETVAKLHHTNIVPIFAVGSERGVNFYAMQFIDGQSLAEVLADKKQPLPPEQVAEWGLQAAEALTHAHQRGVIHRDVKPSNLLLDKEKRLWLTDFGLARRMDDVTLSLTGALLGTPRYMSPEQAVASKKRVDHRSDLFSLGATLYELLTGQPAFAGDTPHHVIQQILTGEPKPIRQANSSVPRDLETVVMKCLAKEPGQRYSAARELADDLRAFLDGRPIRARRANLVELAHRWFKSQQRSARLMATAAAITLAATFAAIFSWSGYDAWRQGSIKLGTGTPPLVAEILDPQGNVVRRETLPMQEAVSLPAGNYRVRAAGEGSLSQTYDVSIQRTSALEYSFDLLDERLLSMDIPRAFAFTDLGKPRKSIVLIGNDGIAPFGWMPPPANKNSPALKEWPGFHWPWSSGSETNSGYGVLDYRPWIAPRGIDLNGDGERDLICAGRHQGWLMAISGKDGNILWFAARGHDLKTPPPPNRPYFQQIPIFSTVVGEPIIDRDCDGDGVMDVIATLANVGAEPVRLTGEQVAAQCWVEAVSGKSGQTIWKYDLPQQWFEVPAGTEVPYQCRWFVGQSTGSSSEGRGTMSLGRHVHRRASRVQRTGTHAYRPDAARPIVMGDRKPLAVIGGTQVALLDPDTGKEVQPPLDFQDRPGRQSQWADVDGDGAADLIVLGERPAATTSDFPKARVAVWSVAKRAELWSENVHADWPLTQSWTIPPPQWPLVADLNGDGKSELAIPDGSSATRGYFSSNDGTPWGAFAMRDGATGKELWKRRLVTMDMQIDQVTAGPDIDGDGWREVYVATLSGAAFRIAVDCLSGQTGRTLWTSSGTPPVVADGAHLAPTRWWNAGQDGWPQLLVEATEDAHTPRQSVVATFSAGTGQVTHVGRGMTTVEPADIDNDGIEDLVVFDSPADRLDFGGKLHVLRGVAAEPWRRIGNLGEPAADFDGDGVIDLVHLWGDGTVVAASGRNGQPLWQVKLVSGYRCVGARPAGVDLDGDGTEDLLAWTDTSGPRRLSYPFHAISGKSGRVLWNSPDISAQMVAGVPAAAAADLDRDGKPEVIWMVASDHGYPKERESWSSHEVQLWLFVTSGQTGLLRWKQPLSRPFGDKPGEYLQINASSVRIAPTIGDVDGDNTNDVVLPAVVGEGQLQSLETRVLSGSNGKQLWSRPFPTDSNNRQESLALWVPPAICDLEGDGHKEVAIVEWFADDAAGAGGATRYRVVAVSGEGGSQRWSWNSQVHASYWGTFPGQSPGQVMRPVALAAGGNRHRIGAILPGSEGKVAVLDADGSVQERKIGHQSRVTGVWGCDIDRDGIDELVFLDQSRLVAARADRLDPPLWTYETGTSGVGRILGIAPVGEAKRPVIALLADPADNTVRGLDAATGQVAWTCPGPIPRADDNTFVMANQLAVLGGGEHEMPFVYYAYVSMARCRQAAQAVQPAAASIAAVPSALRGVTPLPAVLKTAAYDPRWQRNLPWVEQHISWRQGATFTAWGLFFSTFLIVIPAGYLLRLVWLRRFGLRVLLMLPIIAGLVLTAALVKAPQDNDFDTIVGRLLVGLAFAPAVVGVGLLAWWSIRGQWRRAALWIAITMVISLVCAAVNIWQSQRYHPLLPEESYDWTGWYLIWFAGAYLTAWLAIVVLPMKYAIGLAWKWWQSRKGAAPASVASAPTVAVVPTKSATGQRSSSSMH
jgi:predicted Ser/Thr protein kinase